ncbi:MAG: cystathionine gamma-synthase, partial [Actinobacteria bacterium]
MPSLDRSTIWPYRGGEPGEFYYQRYAHPTGVEAEQRLGELDGGHAVLFASGTGAATALALAF